MKRRNRLAWAAAAVFGLAVLAGVVVMAPVLIAGFRSITATPVDVPGTTVRHLGPGEYLVLPRSGTSSSYGPVTVGRGESEAITALTITGPDGDDVALRECSNTTITVNDTSYASAACFTVDSGGEYTITSRSTGPTRMLVTKDPFHRIGGRVAATGVLAAIALAAGVVWIVALVRGGRRRRRELATLPNPPAPPVPPPPPPHGL